jgi:hypothetical protein
MKIIFPVLNHSKRNCVYKIPIGGFKYLQTRILAYGKSIKGNCIDRYPDAACTACV